MSRHRPLYSISFPLDDVELIEVDHFTKPKKPLYSSDTMMIGESEFSMKIEDVGYFFASNGNKIEYSPDEKADPSSLELFLNGSVYGAILHQRRILPLHGSSCIFNNRGIMFCGHSGAGKSSLTTSFCLNGADFLTDDVTPILFPDKKPRIWPKSGKIKLWADSLQQFNREKSDLTKIRLEDEKYYLPMESNRKESCPMHAILILQVTQSENVEIERVQKVEAFSYLHKEIYRREYLFAMPEAESDYLKKISAICNEVPIYRVKRPSSISIDKMRNIIIDNILF